MTDPSGRIIDLPIRSSFREGLTVLEYFISTHGARKGLADTALRTADSGYLTRRLIDVAQDVIIARGRLRHDSPASGSTEPQDKGRARVAARAHHRPLRRARPGGPGDGRSHRRPQRGDHDDDRRRAASRPGIEQGLRPLARSPASRSAASAPCATARALRAASSSTSGEAVGIIAAQSIGEPGTQLTMRTFHTGGVAAASTSRPVCRVSRSCSRPACRRARRSSRRSTASSKSSATATRRTLRITSVEMYRDEYDLPKGVEAAGQGRPGGRSRRRAGASPKVKKAEQEGRRQAKTTQPTRPPSSTARSSPASPARSSVDKDRVSIMYEEREEREYAVPAAARTARRGRRLHPRRPAAHRRPAEPAGHPAHPGPGGRAALPGRRGAEGLPLQGVTINDKHIEVIVRQMLRKVRVDAPGDTHDAAGRATSTASSTRSANAQRPGGGRRAGDGRAGAPRRHQGVAEHEQLPRRRLLPGDDARADRGRDQRPDGPPAGSQGERDHRQADPGPRRDRPAAAARAHPGAAAGPRIRRRRGGDADLADRIPDD